MNHQAKEVKWLDEKEEDGRVVPRGPRSLFQSDSVLYADNNKKSDQNNNAIKPDHGNVQISPQINTGFNSSLVCDRKSYNDQVLKNIQKIRDNINKALSMNKRKERWRFRMIVLKNFLSGNQERLGQLSQPSLTGKRYQ